MKFVTIINPLHIFRLRNGWSYILTCRQFRYAMRQLVTHAGKAILTSACSNCVPQDETQILMIKNFHKSKTEDTIDENTYDMDGNLTERNLDRIQLKTHGCVVNECRFCSNSFIYIAGFFAFSLKNMIKCEECLEALRDSKLDPCKDKSFLLLKNYSNSTHDWNIKSTEHLKITLKKNTSVPPKGLFIPSGSLCSLIFLAEKIYRSFSVYDQLEVWNKKEKCYEVVNTNNASIYEKNIIQKMIICTMKRLPKDLFPSLINSKHHIVTSFGFENHLYSISRLILQKFFALRIKKTLQDRNLKFKTKSGNAIHRHRVHCGD